MASPAHTQAGTPFLTAFGTHFTTVAVDLPGHGRSDVPADLSRFGHDAVSADLVTIMEHLGYQQFATLGYSMGGRLALALALEYPHKVSALVLESASPGLPTDAERRARRRQDEALARQIEAEGVCRFVRYWEDLPLFTSQQGLTDGQRAALRRQRLRNSAAGLAGSLRAAGTGSQPSYWGLLPRLTAPTLLLTGALDSKYCAIARKMKSANPGLTVRQVEAAGHCIHLEQPLRFQRAALDFLIRQEQRHADC